MTLTEFGSTWKPWRAPPTARWRRSPPLGFIYLCQPALVDHPPAGPGWLHEVKHDGFRIPAHKEGARVKVWSRRGADFADGKGGTTTRAIGTMARAC